MAKVIPFNGLRYNAAKVKKIEKAIIPPYDVISPMQLRQYRQQHPFSLIRLVLSQAKPSAKHSPYEAMSAEFRKWQQEGVLQRESTQAFYLYEQSYKIQGKTKRRLGFIGLVKLEPFGKKSVFPHEFTFSKPKADRLEFLHHFKANLEPLFGLYEDPARKLGTLLKKEQRRVPALNLLDPQGIRHRLWAVQTREALKKIEDFLGSKRLLIADGHHRYEAALAYSLLRKKKAGTSAVPEEFVMMYLTNAYDDKGLTILPYHRVLKKLSRENTLRLWDVLTRFFNIKQIKLGRGDLVLKAIDQAEKKQPSLGFYGGGAYWTLLTLKQELCREKIVDRGKSLEWNHLTPAVADKIILEEVLKITPDQKEHYLAYTPHTDEAIKRVETGKAGGAFLMPTPSIQSVAKLAYKGERMPQKSTYFYPKLYSGLVLRKME